MASLEPDHRNPPLEWHWAPLLHLVTEASWGSVQTASLPLSLLHPKGLIHFACQKKKKKMVRDNESLDKGTGFWSWKVLAQATPQLSLPDGTTTSLLIYSEAEIPFGSQSISQAEKQMQELWITEGLAGPNSEKRWCPQGRKGLQVPCGILHTHTHELGIRRNTLLAKGQLSTSAADIGFNICVLIYLTSAEHPKKMFKYGMGNPAAFWVHQISHTPFSNVFSFAKLRMHFAKHVLC